MLCKYCGNPVSQLVQCSTCDRRLERSETVLGVPSGEGYVPLPLEELEDEASISGSDFEIKSFAPARTVNPLLFARYYYLEPGKGGEKPCSLLNQTLRKKRRLAVAEVTIQKRKKVALIKPWYKYLLLIIAHDPSLLVPTDEVDVPDVSVTDLEFEVAGILVETLTEASAESGLGMLFTEITRPRRELIAVARTQGEVAKRSGPGTDLTEALKQSIEQVKKRRATPRRE